MQNLIDQLLDEDFSIMLDNKEGELYSGELTCLESGTEYSLNLVSVLELYKLLNAILVTRKYL